MAEFYTLVGTEKAFTAKLDTATMTAIAADPKKIVGKVVAITGNETVGYGTAGDTIAGVVEPSVELISTNNKNLVVCVRRFRMFEDIPCVGTEVAGDFLAVDGAGGVKKSTTFTNAQAWSVDATNKTCEMLVL